MLSAPPSFGAVRLDVADGAVFKGHDVTIAPAASGFTSSARGTLYVTIAADGTVSEGT